MRQYSYSRFGHKPQKPSRQLMDALILAAADCVLGQQLRTDADGGGAGPNKIDSRILVHAAGGDKQDLRQRQFQRTDVLISSHGRGREDLHIIGAGLPRGDHFGGR